VHTLQSDASVDRHSFVFHEPVIGELGTRECARSGVLAALALEPAVLVADEPEDFARSLIELYESEELWKTLSQNSIKETRASYSTDTATKTLEFLFSAEHLKDLDQSTGAQQPEITLATKS